ncbi:MAG: hypothetical protein J7474_13640 [Arthrobacter sp.]|nr:hypothetical protein [Arthrobacter sp.]
MTGGKHHVFVGPTRSPVLDQAQNSDRIIIHGPARRGSITELLEDEELPGVISIVDGTFHSYPAVGHKEILAAINAGWSVWGLSSMGAIRAAELQSHGMRGFGAVFTRYADDPDFADDEVTVVHSDDGDYLLLSEPMVHLREYIAWLLARGAITSEQAVEATRSLKERWYGERTLDELAAVLQQLQPGIGEQVRSDIQAFHPWRAKDADLTDYLTTKPWLKAEE